MPLFMLICEQIQLAVSICLCVNVKRSPSWRTKGIKSVRLHVAPSAMQTLIKYTIPVSGLYGLVEWKKDEGWQGKKWAGQLGLTCQRKCGRTDGEREKGAEIEERSKRGGLGL